MYMYMSKFVHVMDLLLTLIYNYLYAHLVRKITCTALAYLTNKVRNLFLLLCPGLFCQTWFALSIYTYVENCK